MIWCADCLRFDQFSRLMRHVPAFEPRPSVSTSYPASDVTDSTPSTPLILACSCFAMSFVTSSEVPGGV